MKKIVAYSGENVGLRGEKFKITSIHREIIRLTGKKKVKILVIPTASNDSTIYRTKIYKEFSKISGCKIDTLLLIKEKPSQKEIRARILNSDVVYVGSGNTLKMMRVWRKYSVDIFLKEAYEKGIVLSGMSAGAICWFKCGTSDSRKDLNPKASLILVSCLGIIKTIFSPHYDVEKDRKPYLKKILKKKGGIAIAIDNSCAIEIIDDLYRIISSKKNANAYKTYWQNGKYFEDKIKKESKLKPLEELLTF